MRITLFHNPSKNHSTNNISSSINRKKHKTKDSLVSPPARDVESDIVLGTFTLNLANLFRTCPRHGSRREDRDAENAAAAVSNKEGEVVAAPSSPGSPSSTNHRRLSRRSLFHRRQSSKSSPRAPEDTDDKKVKLHIDQPLTKNGLVTGRLQCDIEAWWMEQRPSKRGGSLRSSGKTVNITGTSPENTADSTSPKITRL